jgi:(p)ppGpp synthase/HD superfamily hydrolase
MHELVKKARSFAEKRHAGHKYGTLPVDIIVHLDNVYHVLMEFGETDPSMLAAGFLHDILEDTKTSQEELQEEFGMITTALVLAVTDGEGKNRKERKEAMYNKTAGHLRFTRLKLADRIANMRYSKAEKSPQLTMYMKEYPEFKARLFFANDGNEKMWETLDALMKSVIPRTFKLSREKDVSGVSGKGIVGEGVIFTNGKCVVTWYGKIASVTVYNTFEDCEQIHGHEGATKFVFDNKF